MLSQSIENLYSAFAKVPAPRWIEACPCCLNDKEIEHLVSAPRRQLSPDDLSAYASKAFLTVGAAEDYLYFLPRILEISATDDRWWPSPEVIGKGIREANPPEWPAHRVEALTSFNAAIIETAISAKAYDSLDPWLCAIANMEFDVKPHLAEVSKDRAAILAYFEDNVRCLPQNELCNSFWKLPNAGHDAIVAWFHSDEIRKLPFEEYGYQM